MKKLFCLILSLVLCSPLGLCYTDSSNSFEIELKEAPSGSGTSHNGLPDGAITAIALGSTFGGLGILSGIGYYFLHSKGLVCGCACGEKSPYQLVDIDNPEIITKSGYRYLIKAYDNASKSKNNKYLVIPDTTIKPNTYNTVFFELPKELVGANYTIIQASAPFSKRDDNFELDTDIFSNGKVATKYSSSVVDANLENGVLIKQGKITDSENRIFALTTSYKSPIKLGKTRAYAIIVVFN